MNTISALWVLALLSAGPASASEASTVMAPVHQFIDGFNKGDAAGALAACAGRASIIDEFAPYEWHGTDACATWARAYEADARANGISNGVVTLGTPWHVDVTGNHAYVVVPVSYAFTQKGKAVREAGSVMTITLESGDKGWLITSWAWAKH